MNELSVASKSTLSKYSHVKDAILYLKFLLFLPIKPKVTKLSDLCSWFSYLSSFINYFCFRVQNFVVIFYKMVPIWYKNYSFGMIWSVSKVLNCSKPFASKQFNFLFQRFQNICWQILPLLLLPDDF